MTVVSRCVELMRPLRAFALMLAVLAGHGTASAIDQHSFWDDRCHECHGHAGAFARRYLRVEAGVLVGRHHTKDLKRFLGQHQMGPNHVDGIYAMLLAQASTSPLYQEKCIGCHRTAAEFARASLERRDGVVVGRKTQRPLADFLRTHGGLRAEDVASVVESLTRVLGEVQSGH